MVMYYGNKKMSIALFKNFYGTPSESQKVWIRNFPFNDQKIPIVHQVYPITVELWKRKVILWSQNIVWYTKCTILYLKLEK